MDVSTDASHFKSNATPGIKLLVRGEIKAARTYLEVAQDLYLGDFLPEEPHNSFITSARLDYADTYTSVIKSLEKVISLKVTWMRWKFFPAKNRSHDDPA